MKDKNQFTGHLSAFFTIFVWATTFISIKILLAEFSPIEIMFFRLVLAYGVLFLASPKFLAIKSFKEEGLFFAAGLCGVTLYFLFQNIALSYTLASNVSVLISIAPFFTALLSRFFAKEEPLQANFFIGFAMAITGILFIAFNGRFILKLNPFGDLLAIACAWVWASYTLIMKKISSLSYSTIQFTRKIFFYGLMLLVPVLGFFDFQLNLTRFASLPNLAHTLFLGFGASALCFVTWNYSVSVLGAVKTSVYIYLIPLITVVLSALFLHESITIYAILGIFLILFGLYFSGRKNSKPDWSLNKKGS